MNIRSTYDISSAKKRFRTQGIMKLLGVRILKVKSGMAELSAENRPALSQLDGFVHAGVLATLMDSAGGYAVLSLLPTGSRVLAVEFKINFMRPATGGMIHATGKVRRLGKKIAVCELEAKTRQGRKWLSCAWGSQTVYCIRPDANDREGSKP
jgi:uncharacterized protein (TIGR00369 family)